jgi:hypothetical protein
MPNDPIILLIDRVVKWLGYDGVAFFEMCYEEYGSPTQAVWNEGDIPHSVHFREGMQVRNFIRMTGLTPEWDAHDYDHNWESIIFAALQICRSRKPKKGGMRWPTINEVVKKIWS